LSWLLFLSFEITSFKKKKLYDHKNVLWLTRKEILCFSIIFYFYPGATGLTIFKTGSALVVGLYKDPMQPGANTVAVSHTGQYLKDLGY
jgi:hypothetical protein